MVEYLSGMEEERRRGGRRGAAVPVQQLCQPGRQAKEVDTNPSASVWSGWKRESRGPALGVPRSGTDSSSNVASKTNLSGII